MPDRVTSSYEHSLQAAYYHIGNRGICVHPQRIAEAKAIVSSEIARNLEICSKQWGIKVYVGAENKPLEGLSMDINDPGAKLVAKALSSVNLNSTSGEASLLKTLQTLGYEVPKIPKKNAEGEYESNYSTGELALQKMLSKNQFNYPGGDPAIKAILKVRELGKLRSAYLNARLYSKSGSDFFLTNYNVAGTLTGRRSSRRHTFGFGNNAQNFPKHSDIASMYRRCLVARPGHILLMVDQISAEDWPVSALAQNTKALAELADTTDKYGRHTRLASAIFNIPLDARTPQEWKDSMERYLGKKSRHASNYGMTAPRMSDALAQEGYCFSIAQCEQLLNRVHMIDPTIETIFHKYIRDTISKTHMLQTPFGRERQFLGARPNDSNNTLFKEAYAYIPQSTVGDNTGFAVLALETQYPPEERFIIQEGHDSIVQDVPDNTETVYKYLSRVQSAFARRIKFHNSIEVEIPVEAEVGYDFAETVRIKEFTRKAVAEAIEHLRAKQVQQQLTVAI